MIVEVADSRVREVRQLFGIAEARPGGLAARMRLGPGLRELA